MKQIINLSYFRDAFKNYGRKDQFSYSGFEALYNYLEETAPDYELDVVGLCCEYTEATLEEVQNSYSDITSISELEEHTSVIMVDSETVIYQNF